MPDPSHHLTATLDHFRADLQHIRTGQATPALIEDLAVDAYGSSLRLKEVAAITTPEPRQLLVEAWDRTQIKAIEAALRQADLNLAVAVDGERIRCALPLLTQERRAEFLTLARQRAEQARVAIRRHRDDELRRVRTAERDGALSEDAADRERKSVETAITEAVDHVSALLANKERELTAL